MWLYSTLHDKSSTAETRGGPRCATIPLYYSTYYFPFKNGDSFCHFVLPPIFFHLNYFHSTVSGQLCKFLLFLALFHLASSTIPLSYLLRLQTQHMNLFCKWVCRNSGMQVMHATCCMQICRLGHSFYTGIRAEESQSPWTPNPTRHREKNKGVTFPFLNSILWVTLRCCSLHSKLAPSFFNLEEAEITHSWLVWETADKLSSLVQQGRAILSYSEWALACQDEGQTKWMDFLNSLHSL